jgi:hypothetical protein
VYENLEDQAISFYLGLDDLISGGTTQATRAFSRYDGDYARVGGPMLTCKITIAATRLPKCCRFFSAVVRLVIYPKLTSPDERNETHVKYCPQI